MARLIRVCAVVGVLTAAVGTVVSVALLGPAEWVSGFDWFVASFAIFFGVLALIVVPKEPRNPLVWIMAGAALFGGLTTLGWPVAGWLGESYAGLTGEVVPADLPRASAWILAMTGWLWALSLLPPLTFGLLLFPSGELPSPRWKWVGLLAGAGITITAIGSAWSYRPWSDGVAEEGFLVAFGFALVFISAALSLAALIRGFRLSRGIERQQYKWVSYGTSILIPTFLGVGFLLAGTDYENLLIAPIMAAELIFLCCYAMAVGKYGLFEIDKIISRTVSYGVVVGFLAIIYLGLVAAMTIVLPSQSSLAVAVGTLVVAAIFNPLRRKVQQGVDRRFNRTHYNVQRVVDEFIDSLRDVGDSHAVASRWARTVQETMQPTLIGIWIRDE